VHIELPAFVMTGEYTLQAETTRGILTGVFAWCSTAAVQPGDVVLQITAADRSSTTPYPIITLPPGYINRSNTYEWTGFIEIPDTTIFYATKSGNLNNVIHVEFKILKIDYAGAILEYLKNAARN